MVYQRDWDAVSTAIYLVQQPVTSLVHLRCFDLLAILEVYDFRENARRKQEDGAKYPAKRMGAQARAAGWQVATSLQTCPTRQEKPISPPDPVQQRLHSLSMACQAQARADVAGSHEVRVDVVVHIVAAGTLHGVVVAVELQARRSNSGQRLQSGIEGRIVDHVNRVIVCQSE